MYLDADVDVDVYDIANANASSDKYTTGQHYALIQVSVARSFPPIL